MWIEALADTPLLWLLDFDGTLVPIAETPDGIRVSPSLPALFRALEDRGDVVWIVTGRRADDVTARVEGARVVGLHGLDWSEGAAPARDGRLDAALVAADALRARWPGILLEDKGAALGFHYRRVPEPARADARAAIEAAVRPFADAGLTLLDGHCVVELRPQAASKGNAVRALVERYPALRPVYVGDDATDEEGIAALPPSGIGVRVGPPDVPTGAAHRLADVDAVLALLRFRCAQGGAG
jgi:trehalose 6-phosphate phosphatase